VLALIGLMGMAGLPPGLAAADKPYGVIIATVFRETGHALPGAELTLTASAAKKAKTQKVSTSPRGEGVLRVPPGPMRYTLTVKAKGYRMQAKTVEIQADERIDVNFLLEVEKK